MSPEFAEAIDPVVVETLRFQDAVEHGGDVVTSDWYQRILGRIEAAESKISDGESRRLSKLALCAWIDSLLIRYTNWDHREWWKSHTLEYYLFRHRTSDNEFYNWAIDAARMPNKDTLEVFYLMVLLGYRGLYDEGIAAHGERQDLPETLDRWCENTSNSLRLMHNRPQISEVVQTAGSFEPLRGRANLALYSMIGIVLAGVAVGLAIVEYSGLF
jgi:type VI secretion system protein ImpK